MKSQKGSSSVELLIYGVILAVFLLVGGAKAILYLATGADVVATVSEKGERCKSKDNCKYLIYTDQGVYENTDAWLNLKFNSSDVYGDIKPNTKYKFHTNGIRFGFLNWYPNITSVQEVK